MTTSSDHTIQDVTTVARTTHIPDGLITELRDLVTAATTPTTVNNFTPAPEAPTPTTPEEPTVKPMNRDKPELPAYMIALIGLIIIGVLTFHGDTVPDILNLAVIGSLGIGGAVTTPKSGGGE